MSPAQGFVGCNAGQVVSWSRNVYLEPRQKIDLSLSLSLAVPGSNLTTWLSKNSERFRLRTLRRILVVEG